MKIILTLCFIFAAQVSFAAEPATSGAPATAHEPAMPGEHANDITDKTLLAKQMKNPCKDDLEKFCKGVKPGNGGIMKCLKAHESHLSPACKVQEETMKKSFQAHGQVIQDECKAELKKYCSAVRGPREMFACLGDHGKNLSKGCRAALPPAKK
jgi:hypothetical protein